MEDRSYVIEDPNNAEKLWGVITNYFCIDLKWENVLRCMRSGNAEKYSELINAIKELEGAKERTSYDEYPSRTEFTLDCWPGFPDTCKLVLVCSSKRVNSRLRVVLGSSHIAVFAENLKT